MTIAAISPTSFSGAASTASVTERKGRVESVLAPVAQLFGESAQQLEGELRSGKTSMTALAQSKGVSQSDLVDAIKKGLQDGAKAGGVQLSDTQLSNLANGMANRVHGGHHHLRRGADAAGGVTAGGATSGATAASGSGASSSGAAVDGDGDHDGTPGTPGPLGASKPSTAHSTISRLLFELQAQAAASTATASKAAQTEIAEKFAAATPSPAPEPSRLDKVA